MTDNISVIENHHSHRIGLITKIFAAVSAVLAFSLASIAPASAASPASPNAGKDLSYSYLYQTVTHPDGTTDMRHITGTVDYTKSGNTFTARTVCTYGKQPYPGASIAVTQYDGHYSVPYAIADTSAEGVRTFCLANFNNRVYQ